MSVRILCQPAGALHVWVESRSGGLICTRCAVCVEHDDQPSRPSVSRQAEGASVFTTERDLFRRVVPEPAR